MRVAVIIPTTAGPVWLLRLAALRNAPRSVMRTQDDYRPLPVSAAYQAFAAPGGPLDMALGLDAPAFDLRLSAPIETGRSWELPVALAHWLRAEGHDLVGKESVAGRPLAAGTDAPQGPPDLVVWATGALDMDMGVIAQNYHLPRKIAASRDLLAAVAAEGSRVALLRPGPVELPEWLETDFACQTINSLAQATEALRPLLGTTPTPRGSYCTQTDRRAVPSAGRGGWFRAGAGVLGAVFLAVAAALAMAPGWRAEPVVTAPEQTSDSAQAEIGGALETDLESDSDAASGPTPDTMTGGQAIRPDPDMADIGSIADATEAHPEPNADPPAAPGSAVADATAPLTLVLLRPPEGASCIAVHFGETEPVRDRLLPGAEGYEVAAILPLCAIGLHWSAEAEGSVTVHLPEDLLAHITRSDRIGTATLMPGDQRILRLTADLPERLELDWQLMNRAGETVTLRQILNGAR